MSWNWNFFWERPCCPIWTPSKKCALNFTGWNVFFFLVKKNGYTYWWELGQGTFSGSSWLLETKLSVEKVKSVVNLTKFALLITVSEGVMGWFWSSSPLKLFFDAHFEVKSDVKKTWASGSFDIIVPGWNKVNKIKSKSFG